jgi:cytochrome c-type biogenesis protein CcmE
MVTARQRAVRIILSATVIIGAFSALFFAMASNDAQFYKHVDEVMVRPADWYGKKMQVHGFVDGQPLQERDTLNYKFIVKQGGSTVPVTYSGIVPDTFKAGSEVVVTGVLSPDGFHATDITAKCPSKYQPASPARATSGGH